MSLSRQTDKSRDAESTGGSRSSFLPCQQLSAAPKDVLKRYEKWLDVAAISGPPGLRVIKGFHDESLSGEWQGHRSCRLPIQYRIVYRVVAADQLFQVVSATAHDYRRP